MNVFRCNEDRSLDRVYLRTCAIYRLLKSKRIGQAQALELQGRRFRCWTYRPVSKDYLTPTIEIWKSGPIKDMLP
jgi:hypothetical protein